MFHQQNIIKGTNLIKLCHYQQSLSIFIKKTQINFRLVLHIQKILEHNQYQINIKLNNMIVHSLLQKFNLILILNIKKIIQLKKELDQHQLKITINHFLEELTWKNFHPTKKIIND